MDRSKIPTPSSLARVAQDPSRPKNDVMSKHARRPPMVKPAVLRRRSKSTSDLRLPQPLSILQRNLTKANVKPALVPAGQKRTAQQKSDEQHIPKLPKIRIPDWDYRSRFQELQKKALIMQEDLNRLKAQTEELATLTTECDALRMELAVLKEKQKVNEKTITEINHFKSTYFPILIKLTRLDDEHQQLLRSYKKVQDECIELQKYKSKFESMQIKAEALETLNMQLRQQLAEKGICRKEQQQNQQ